MGWYECLKRRLDEQKDDDTTASCETSPCERALHRKLAKVNEEDGHVVRLRLLFSGDVQGVGFRWTNQNVARQHHLTGWVKNLSDGTVAMEIQGSPAAVSAHLALIHAPYAKLSHRIWLEKAEELTADTSEQDFDVHM